MLFEKKVSVFCIVRNVNMLGGTISIMVALLLFTNSHGYCQQPDNQRSYYVQIKVKHDFPSATTFYGGSKLTAGNGVALEILHGSKEKVSVGVGIEYKYFRKIEHHHSWMLSFVPVYIKMQGSLIHVKNYNFYIAGQFGHSFCILNDNFDDMFEPEGGGCFEILIGNIIMNNYFFEGSFSTNGGNLRDKSGSNDRGLGYPKVSVGLGFIFD